MKRKLISGVSNYLKKTGHKENILLIDYAVGKAGDLMKWVHSDLRYVLGIDISKDNIINSKDGACVRYLNARKKDKFLKLRALFVHGNSSLNIRSEGSAFETPLEKELVQSVFGNKSGSDYFEQGIARDGFHISSCQFAMHYMFENRSTFHNFLRNLAECTRLNGYFIGTCFVTK